MITLDMKWERTLGMLVILCVVGLAVFLVIEQERDFESSIYPKTWTIMWTNGSDKPFGIAREVNGILEVYPIDYDTPIKP